MHQLLIVIFAVMILKKELKILHVNVQQGGGMMEVNVDLALNLAQLVIQKPFVLGVIMKIQAYMLILMVCVKIATILV